MRHQLDINVLPTQSPFVMVLQDTSQYVQGMAVTGPVLELVVPGGPAPVTIVTGLTAGFTRIIQPYELGWGKLGGPSTVLPDGLFQIRYYLVPGLVYTVTRKHFRIASLRLRYDKLLNAVLDKGQGCCKKPNALISELLELDAYFNLIQANAADCDQTGRAQELYDYVCHRLDELERIT